MPQISSGRKGKSRLYDFIEGKLLPGKRLYFYKRELNLLHEEGIL